MPKKSVVSPQPPPAKPRKPVAPLPISQRSYAKHRGETAGSVQRAIASGRLKTSLVLDKKGVPKIKSVELADAEWEAKTRPSAEANAKNLKAQRKLPVDKIDYNEARRRTQIEVLKQSKLASEEKERALARERGDTISRDEARDDVIEAYTRVRTKLLGVPKRCKQRIPHLTVKEVGIIMGLQREALEELADDN